MKYKGKHEQLNIAITMSINLLESGFPQPFQPCYKKVNSMSVSTCFAFFHIACCCDLGGTSFWPKDSWGALNVYQAGCLYFMVAIFVSRARQSFQLRSQLDKGIKLLKNEMSCRGICFVQCGSWHCRVSTVKQDWIVEIFINRWSSTHTHYYCSDLPFSSQNSVWVKPSGI